MKEEANQRPLRYSQLPTVNGIVDFSSIGLEQEVVLSKYELDSLTLRGPSFMPLTQRAAELNAECVVYYSPTKSDFEDRYFMKFTPKQSQP